MEKTQQVAAATDKKKYIPLTDPKWFDYIEAGCTIRWLRRGTEQKIDRFDMGGIMLRQCLDRDGNKCFMVGNRRGAKVGGTGPDGKPDVVRIVKFDDVEILYKHFSLAAFVEISLLREKLEALEQRLAAMGK